LLVLGGSIAGVAALLGLLALGLSLTSAAPSGASRSDSVLASTEPTEPAEPPVAEPTVAIPAIPAPVPTGLAVTVTIDAGHQAKADSSLEPVGPGASERKAKVAGGATGVNSHAPESLVNLQIATRLRDELRARGVTVVMVRETQDVSISNSARAAVANKAGSTLFIRLHCDGNGNRSLAGLSTLVPANNRWTAPILAPSTEAARMVHAATIAATGAKDRGVITRSDLSGFNWATVPTVLVEMGFLSNPEEDALLNSAAYQQKLAVGMADGIMQYARSK
jgi:N-acetylmuramoyl-L-alanine amidase